MRALLAVAAALVGSTAAFSIAVPASPRRATRLRAGLSGGWANPQYWQLEKKVAELLTSMVPPKSTVLELRVDPETPAKHLFYLPRGCRATAVVATQKQVDLIEKAQPQLTSTVQTLMGDARTVETGSMDVIVSVNAFGALTSKGRIDFPGELERLLRTSPLPGRVLFCEATTAGLPKLLFDKGYEVMYDEEAGHDVGIAGFPPDEKQLKRAAKQKQRGASGPPRKKGGGSGFG